MAETGAENQEPPSIKPFLRQTYGFLAKNPDIDWATKPEHENPRMAAEYADLLVQQGLLPLADRASGFTLFSPSANQGIYEYTMAKKVDDSLTGKLEKQPVFIAADMFGTKTKTGKEKEKGKKFEPGFRKDISRPEDLTYVKFHKLSADAENIPLSDATVDIVWDRLGALWHTQEERMLMNDVSDQKIQDLLNEYKRILKPDGCVIIDSGSITRGAGQSTYEYLHAQAEQSVDFNALGWSTQQIGSGETQLTVLKPISKEAK
jgi:SAM-dependent methyltransferase